jgi:hypothetical protein
VSEARDPRFERSVEITGYRRKVSRGEHGMRRKILECLGGGPKTVPEIAAALGVTTHEAMWWVMGFVRYGYISPSERADADGYYTYEAVGKEE